MFSRRADEAKSWMSTKPSAVHPPPSAPSAPTGQARKPHPSEGRWGKQEAPAQPESAEANVKPSVSAPEKTDNMCASLCT